MNFKGINREKRAVIGQFMSCRNIIGYQACNKHDARIKLNTLVPTSLEKCNKTHYCSGKYKACKNTIRSKEFSILQQTITKPVSQHMQASSKSRIMHWLKYYMANVKPLDVMNYAKLCITNISCMQASTKSGIMHYII